MELLYILLLFLREQQFWINKFAVLPVFTNNFRDILKICNTNKDESSIGVVLRLKKMFKRVYILNKYIENENIENQDLYRNKDDF